MKLAKADEHKERMGTWVTKLETRQKENARRWDELKEDYSKLKAESERKDVLVLELTQKAFEYEEQARMQQTEMDEVHRHGQKQLYLNAQARTD